MTKVVLVRTGPLGKVAIETGQRTLRFKKKDYDFALRDVIMFYYPMDGMNVLMEGKYEVTEIDSGMQGKYAILSFRKIREYEDE